MKEKDILDMSINVLDGSVTERVGQHDGNIQSIQVFADLDFQTDEIARRNSLRSVGLVLYALSIGCAHQEKRNNTYALMDGSLNQLNEYGPAEIEVLHGSKKDPWAPKGNQFRNSALRDGNLNITRVEVRRVDLRAALHGD